MPLARISIPAHLPARQARALADAVHAGLAQTCGVPPEDRFQLIQRLPEDAMILDPHFGNVSRTRDASIVEITFLRGRTDAQKRALFQSIAAQAEAGGFASDDVLVALTENGPIDWSLGRGLAFQDA
jgi:phenylpyruvate tautomerase PptA (4-oxalocrotonate tautomerase family)